MNRPNEDNGGDSLSRDILDIFVEAIRQRHGYRVVALDMSDVPLTMEAFLVATAENRIQARAVADNVMETASRNGFRKHHISGCRLGSCCPSNSQNAFLCSSGLSSP